MNADRVIVGEVLGDEVIPMLNAMSQGRAGSMCTIHANSAAGTFTQIGNYMLQAPERLTMEQSQALAAQDEDAELKAHFAPLAEALQVAESAGAADLAGAARGTPAPDPSFVAGPYTRGLWNSLSAQGYTEATAAAAAYPTYAFSLQGGGALVFFAVRLVTTATAPAGSTITVAPNSGFSAFIAPGSYQTVTNTELLDVAAVIPPASSGSGVKVVGLADAVIAITGTGASGLA
jgi:hypothetical protein